MTPHREEALRSLRMADHDIAAFAALVKHPEVHPAMACFHAQQAVEKCLKAVLFSSHVEFHRTHDLMELGSLLERNGVQIAVSSEWLKSLNPFAVAFRYEETATGRLDTAALSDVVGTLRRWAGELVAQAGSRG